MIMAGPPGLVSRRFLVEAISPKFTVTEAHRGSKLTCCGMDSYGNVHNTTAQIDVLCRCSAI